MQLWNIRPATRWEYEDSGPECHLLVDHGLRVTTSHDLSLEVRRYKVT